MNIKKTNIQLNNTQVDNLCKSIVANAQQYDFYSHIIFESLYNTGLRINELLDKSRLEILTTKTILIDTQKHSRNRIIKTDNINNTYLDYLFSNQLYLIIRSYKYYRLKFFQFNPLHTELLTKNKQISTHLFRHNYIKKLHKQGLAVNEISKTIGEKEDKNTLNYINSIIYYKI